MSDELTIDLIRARTTSQSFSRAQSYYKNGAIFDTVQRGNQIEGFSEASSQPEPYHIQVTLGDEGVVGASCTCQYEYGGDCKHIVALLLTYLNTPEKFEQYSPINKTLASRNKEQLIGLIHKMIERYPDLQSLVDLPVPAKSARRTPLDTNVFRKQMRKALRDYGGWGDVTAERTIYAIMTVGDEFAKKDDWRSASAIYRVILEECTAVDDYPVSDDEGEFAEAFDATLAKLATCLEQPDIANDEEERKVILDALLSVFTWDTEMGGMGIGEEAPDYIVRYARPSDLAALREKITSAQKRKSRSSYGNWAVGSYASFLVELDALDNTDPEVTLTRLRDEGLFSLLTHKLLEMNRIDEAVSVIEHSITSTYEKLAELPRLVAIGRADDAIRIGKQMLQAGYDRQIGGWLLEQYKSRGDWEPYLELQRQEMFASPSEYNYVLLEEVAQKLNRWEPIRLEIMNWLKQERRFDVLAEVYLHNQEWDAAWDVLEQQKKAPKTLWNAQAYVQLDLKVAQRSQTARPLKAIAVYHKYILWHISQRDRKHYQIAVNYLATIRDLYQQLGNDAAWQTLISGIRSEFPTLRALQDELQKAHL